jgi:ribosomal protein L37AE/L43A
VNLTQVQVQAQSKSTDEIIKDICMTYIDNLGWADVMEVLPTLEETPDQQRNGVMFSAWGWIGAHLCTVLREEVTQMALREKRCGNCGAELNVFVLDAWWQCPKCFDTFADWRVGE